MTDFQSKPGNTREANQVISENVRQQLSGSVQLRSEYASSVERRCELTRKFLTRKGIRCESRKSAKTLCAYGGKEPLPTLGLFQGMLLRLAERILFSRCEVMTSSVVGSQPKKKTTQILVMKHQNTLNALF